MGFDLTGRKPINMINIDKPYIDWSKNPSSEEKEQYSRDMEAYEKAVPGDYFRNNVWWWRPLWTYVCEVCDDILTEDEMGSGSYNDGTIIYKYKAIQIAKRLQTLIDDGKVKEYAEKYTNKLKALPLEECEHCNGDGMRTIEKDGKPTRIRCNSCNSEHKETDVPIGKVRGWSCHYPFDEDNVKTFTEFCRNSGGFEIW